MSSLSLDFSEASPVDGYYDIFLSFRGDDTRRGFTTHLYETLKRNHIHTFMDEHNLTCEDIDHIFEVISKSRMAVVIYSENFASSDWCLRELETILQRREDKKMLVTPIFYKVDLKELKHITGKTATYFDQHVAAYGNTTAHLWKVAVRNLGRVSGFSYNETGYRSEYEFTMQVTAIITKKLLTQERSIKSSQVNNHSPSSDPLATKQNSRQLNDQVDKEEEKSTTFYDEAKVPGHNSYLSSRSKSSHGFFSNNASSSEVVSPSTNHEVTNSNCPKQTDAAASSNDRVMTIYVIALFRPDRIILQVHPGTTIGTIKAQLRKMLRLKLVTEDKQHLYFNGDVELKDNTRTLASYNIPDEATLCTFK